eukprot:CAMPEP_0176484762 /NCGR_PEP_ID=MMETSP0200_2-20121128/4634_1 /TAXON_ID=947934 /ORGANISM="Chaetoceros sp., Strain GSL56" /LENGTH=813 /DNA_ID=CAMNT_0017881271 /DNA_START=167 /DNA_END=2605 /DNA_ORIENTATION=-
MTDQNSILKEQDMAMTKSKKKRLKRLKAKELREEDEELKNKFLPKDSSVLNPIDKMRKDLVNAGYDIDTVDMALEKMWNLQMDYSNFDSVLNFLTLSSSSRGNDWEKEKRPDANAACRCDSNEDIVQCTSFEFPESPKADSSLVDTAPLSFSTTGKSEAVEDTEDASPSIDDGRSVCLSDKEETRKAPEYLNCTLHKHDNVTQQQQVSEEIVKSVPPLPALTNTKGKTAVDAKGRSNNAAPRSDSMVWKQPMKEKDCKKNIRIKPFDLSAKLEIVANNEKLADGIIALTEWVVKAASPMEIQQLCAQCSNDNALKIVVRRSMQEHLTSANSSVGQLLDLVGSILRAVYVPSSQVMSTAKALGSLLKEASRAMDDVLNHDDENKIRSCIADAVANNVTRTIATIVNHYVGNLDSKDAMMHRLEKEIQQLESSAMMVGSKSGSSNSPSIVELMTTRDKTKLVLDKYSILFSLSLERKNFQDSNRKTEDFFQLTETSIMKDVLGDDYQSVVQSKTKLEELKVCKNQKSSEMSQMETLVNDVSALSSEKKRISSRMEELRRELEELVVKEKEIDGKLKDSEAMLKTLEGSLSVESRELSEEIDALNRKVKIDDSVSFFAKKVCEFAKVMESVHDGKSKECVGEEDGATKQSILNEFSLFLKASSRYFTSELNTISFLKSRVEDAQKDIPKLQREIKEFESLGMTTTVTEMKKKEKDLLNSVFDDSELVESLTGEAETAKSDFLNQLESFLSSLNLADIEDSSQIDMLRDIDTCLCQLRINEDSKWKKIMTQVEGLVVCSPKKPPAIAAEVKPLRTAW